MNLVDLIKAGKLYDALLLTVGLVEKSEREEMDIEVLITAYRLCHTKETDAYLLDMIKAGILKILYNVMQKKVQVEDLLKVAEVVSVYHNSATVNSYFVEYLTDFLYRAAQTMHSRGDDRVSYRCLSAIAAFKMPIRAEYVLFENELKGGLRLPSDYTVFAVGGDINRYSEQAPAHLQNSAGMRDRCLRVDILLEFPTVWCKVKSLYEALSKDESFDCQLVAIDMQEFAWNSAEEYPAFLQFLNERDIPFIPEAAYNFSERSPDVLVYTNPYDNHHPKFSIENVRRKGIRIVYLPYSIPFFIDNNNRGYLYDLPIHRQAWRVYVRSKRELRKYGMYCQAGNAHVALAGAPLRDYLAEQKEWVKPDARFKKTFLWGIDYGFWDHTATFGEYGAKILQYFTDHPQLGLIVRPHPLFFGSVTKRGVMSEETVRSFYKQCNDLPNISLDLCGDLTASFCKSDALISDTSSILVEYLLMERPVLYLRMKDTPDYREYQEDDSDVLAHYYSGDSFERIVHFIEMVVANQDPMREERKEILEKYFYHHQENAGENIKEMLKVTLKNL
ncbi:MAG: CDP-glycerol glycerophosphotransferase family protein [Selenomonas noxia]|jgi:possible TPR repeat-containing protein